MSKRPGAGYPWAARFNLKTGVSTIPFERYADDAICHCANEAQNSALLPPGSSMASDEPGGDAVRRTPF
jgi:hypothetical protein